MVKAESKPSFQGGQGGSPRYKNADPIEYGLLKAYARENRKNQTEAESILWNQIRGESLGVTFLRQYIIGAFITDFAELDKEMLPYTKECILKLFEPLEELEIKSSPIWYDDRTDFSESAVGTPRVSHKEEHGFEVLN